MHWYMPLMLLSPGDRWATLHRQDRLRIIQHEIATLILLLSAGAVLVAQLA